MYFNSKDESVHNLVKVIFGPFIQELPYIWVACCVTLCSKSVVIKSYNLDFNPIDYYDDDYDETGNQYESSPAYTNYNSANINQLATSPNNRQYFGYNNNGLYNNNNGLYNGISMNQLGTTGLGPTGIGGANMNLGNGANYGANYGANSNFGVGGFNGRAANSYGLTGKKFD